MTLTSPLVGPVAWVALSFPGPVLGPEVAAPLADRAPDGVPS